MDIQARTVEDAVRLALEQLGRTRDQVKVEVLATDPGGDEVLVRVIAPDLPGSRLQEEASPRAGRPPYGGGAPRDRDRGERGDRDRDRGYGGDRGNRGDRGGDRQSRPPYGGSRYGARPGGPRPAPIEEGLPGEIQIDSSLMPTEDTQSESATPQDAIAPIAAEVLQKILLEMRIRGRIARRYPSDEGDAAFTDDSDSVVLNVEGLNERDQSIVIGRRGETLEALQLLMNLILGRQVDFWARVIVDVEGYRLRRKLALMNLARRTAEQVQTRKQAIPLEAMSPYERRIVHMTLQDHEAVTTESTGVEPERRVVVLPK
ncbi:MAG TPA: R3H domain-containing nucleic acid-binding protein [Chloroflexia bacterium]|nr:R3H domain-containing nucleic acid-binding protein [Chloroflexia bacterium]